MLPTVRPRLSAGRSPSDSRETSPLLRDDSRRAGYYGTRLPDMADGDGLLEEEEGEEGDDGEGAGEDGSLYDDSRPLLPMSSVSQLGMSPL